MPTTPSVAGESTPTQVVSPPGKSAFAEERQAKILTLLQDRGRVRNTELADVLQVTEPTVRKDIADLAGRQLLRRTHGGAIALRAALEPNLADRQLQHAEAKTRIARSCLALIGDGDAIFLDGGSTVQRIAELLVADPDDDLPHPPRNVNVLTNAMSVAGTVASHPQVRHTVLGGTFRPAGGSFVGPLTLQALDSFTVNLAFIGVTGLSDRRFTVADLNEAQVKAAVTERARHVVVPMDQSKLGVIDFAVVCGIQSVGTIVTDASNQYLDDLTAGHGVKLIVADD